MNSILSIRTQKLFAVALFLKIGTSFLGWHLQMPWTLGFGVPLSIMALYIVLGWNRRDSDVSDEKFADSCYYLGFIFTITSIIFSLMDLPNIGTRIQDISVRFGAAMVSTVFGLAVRVYLVSFKKDVGDAIKDAEEGVLDATRKFTERLSVALDRLRDFESQVDTAAKSSVERVNMQVENLSKNHAEKLAGFFADLTTRNQEAFTGALSEVRTASQRLSDSVDGYSEGMRTNLGSIEAKVGAFTEAVTARLQTTTFPDDYFAKELNTPLAQLRDRASLLSDGVKTASSEVSESSVVLTKALKKLRDKASATEDSLDTVQKLTEQQGAVLGAAQGQLTTLGQLTTTLTGIDAALAKTLLGITASQETSAELAHRVSALVEQSAGSQRDVDRVLSTLVDRFEASVAASNSVADKLTASTAVSERIAGKLDELTMGNLAQANERRHDSMAPAALSQARDPPGSEWIQVGKSDSESAVAETVVAPPLLRPYAASQAKPSLFQRVAQNVLPATAQSRWAGGPSASDQSPSVQPSESRNPSTPGP